MDQQSELLKYIYQEDDIFIVDEQQEQVAKAIEKPLEVNSSSPPIASEPEPITFFGENSRGILILVNDPTSEFLNTQDLNLLMKIIEAGLKFSKKDIALVNIFKFPTSRVVQEISHNNLISFGTIETISTDKPLNQVIDFHGKKTLFSHQLSEISMDVEKKKELWKALQSMFNI